MAIGAALTWCLALEHLAVLGDTVALAVGNSGLSTRSLVLSGSPGEVVTADLNVVVGELAKLVVIHTEKLGLLRSAELESWNFIDGEGDDGADNEGVSGSGDDVSNLHVHLLPVLCDPATGEEASVDTVEANDVGGTEETVEDETDNSSDTVLSEHIHSIIDLDPELDCEGISVM